MARPRDPSRSGPREDADPSLVGVDNEEGAGRRIDAEDCPVGSGPSDGTGRPGTIVPMASQDDVRRIALALPATTEDAHAFRFFVDGKAFAWSWLERIDPKRARVASPDVIAVRVANEDEKQALIDMDPEVFFTERHYDGYPAVMVRLAAVDLDLLERLLTGAWRSRAPRRRPGQGGGRDR